MSNKNLDYIAIGIFIITTIVLYYYLFIYIPHKHEQKTTEPTISKEERITQCKKEVAEKVIRVWNDICEKQKNISEKQVAQCIKEKKNKNPQQSENSIEKECQELFPYKVDENGACILDAARGQKINEIGEKELLACEK